MIRHRQFLRLLFLLLTATFGILAVPGRAQAQENCTASATPLNYGTFVSPNNVRVDSAATLTLNCDDAVALQAVRVCVSMQDASLPLSSGANSLAQSIYKDHSRAALFGSFLSSGTGGVQIDTSTGLGSFSVHVNLYGSVPSSHRAQSGTYFLSADASNLQVAYQIAALAPLLRPCSEIATGIGGLRYVALASTATVQPACSVSATNLSFPDSGLLTSVRDGTSTLSVTCSNALPYGIALSGGNANAIDPTQRKMSNGSDQITYGLYQDPNRSQPWGSSSSQVRSGTGNGAAQSIPVYGRVPAQTTPAPGAYSDTVVVTVTY